MRGERLKSISIQNVPDEIYSAVQEMARANRRSLQEQITFILEQEIKLLKGTPLSTAAKWRKRLEGRRFTDSVTMVRQDRNR